MAECPSFDFLYEASIRNGYYVPPKKAPCVTLNYLYKVRRKAVWCQPSIKNVAKYQRLAFST